MRKWRPDPRRDAAAVVGSGGFIGAHLTAELSAAGFPVHAYSRSTPLFDGRKLSPGLRGVGTIFYLASSVNPALAELRPDLVAEDHATFAELLARLESEGGRPTVVLASSGGSVYAAEPSPPYSEDAETRPNSAYGVAKVRLEAELLSRSDLLPGVVLRLANVYGPGQRTGTGQGVIGHWLEAAARDRRLRIYGDHGRMRDYVYVDDVVEVLLGIHHRRATRRHPVPGDQPPSIVNVGSGIGTPLWRLLELVLRTVGGVATVESVPGRAFDQRDVWLDISRARQALRWQPRTSLEDGLRTTWEHLSGVWPTDPAAHRCAW